MAAQKKYPDELRERAARMVLEIRERDGKGHGRSPGVARQLDVHPEALRSWLQQAEIYSGITRSDFTHTAEIFRRKSSRKSTIKRL